MLLICHFCFVLFSDSINFQKIFIFIFPFASLTIEFSDQETIIEEGDGELSKNMCPMLFIVLTNGYWAEHILYDDSINDK